MRKGEKIALGRINEVLRRMSEDRPANPANICAISAGNCRQTKAARWLVAAINDIGFGDDWEDDLREAEKVYERTDDENHLPRSRN